jgi:hypothetical protein
LIDESQQVQGYARLFQVNPAVHRRDDLVERLLGVANPGPHVILNSLRNFTGCVGRTIPLDLDQRCA